MTSSISVLPGVTALKTRLLITGGVLSLSNNAVPARLDLILDAEGCIEAIAAPDTFAKDRPVLSLDGDLISPAFVDCHQHLDKTGSLPFTPNPSGTLLGAIQSFGTYARGASRSETRDRALATIARCLKHGSTAIRSHVNVDNDTGMNGLQVLAEIREDLRDVMTIQLVSFLSSGAGQDMDWLQKHAVPAARLGDAVGGTPALAKDPFAYLDCLFETAVETQLPLDLHMDEHLNAQVHLFDAVMDRIEKYGMRGRVNLGHCSVLSALEPSEFSRLCDRILENEVSVVTLPSANLYLQARDASKLPARGLTRVRELMDAGVTVATASDNIQDPFVPIGSGDMAELARWTLVAAQMFADDMARVFDMTTKNAATYMGLKDFGRIKVGNAANLVISDARDENELVAGGSSRRQVISNGFVISN